MAKQKMRHFNSPEELEKRAAQPPRDPRDKKKFRHWNSPEEVAKRVGAPKSPASSAIVPRAPTPMAAAPWPPPGQANNAAEAGEPQQARRAPEPTGTLAERVKQLETLVYTLVDSPGEARELRMLLSNFGAVTDTQQGFNQRLNAIEATLDDLGEQLEAAVSDEPEVDVPEDGPEVAPEAPAPEEAT